MGLLEAERRGEFQLHAGPALLLQELPRRLASRWLAQDHRGLVREQRRPLDRAGRSGGRAQAQYRPPGRPWHRLVARIEHHPGHAEFRRRLVQVGAEPVRFPASGRGHDDRPQV